MTTGRINQIANVISPTHQRGTPESRDYPPCGA